MDDELINSSMDEVILSEKEIAIKNTEKTANIDGRIDVVDVELEEEINIDIEDEIGWVGGDYTKHYSLSGRDEADQHPISSITGLRSELDEIQSLKTVYSDKKNYANYYLWQDRNILKENRVGYFVTASSNVDEIELCTSEKDILGVTVDTAGFVGAQADINRDIQYGLVVSSGKVRVRCELPIEVGDYVVSNNYGYATKNNSGYRVVGRHQINGIEYVEIMLVTPIQQICDLTDDLENITDRMDDAEANIASAMAIATDAYNKAGEANQISEDAIKNALDAIEKANKSEGKVDGFGEDIGDIKKKVEETKRIADSAVNTAIQIQDETMEAVNEANKEISELRDEFVGISEDINVDLNATIGDLEALKKDLEPLALWPEESSVEDATSYAGFVARADETSALLASMVGCDFDKGQSLSGFTQEATDTYAAAKLIATYTNGDVSGASGFITQVNDNTSELSAVANRTFTKKDGTEVVGLAGLVAQATENGSDISLITNRINGKYIIIPEVIERENRDTSKIYCAYVSGTLKYYYYNSEAWYISSNWMDITDKDEGAVYYVSLNKTYWYFSKETNQWNNTTDISATGLIVSIAGIQVEVDDNSSTISQLTSWQGSINTNMTSIKQKTDDNEASITLLASSIDKYSVGEYSQSYNLTRSQANSILKSGIIYIPTKDHSETFVGSETSNYFTIGCYYEWDFDAQNKGDWIEHSDGKVWISSELPNNSSGTYKYWYVKTNTPPSGYEAYALYMWNTDKDTPYWEKVNILAGNVNNRITSMIQQNANQIAIDVASAKGNIASHQQWIDNNSTNITNVVTWKSNVEDDVSNISTIQQTANDNTASISQVATRVRGEYETIDSWSSTDKKTNLVYYVTADKKYRYYKNGQWKSTSYPIEAGLEISAASIVTAVNNSASTVLLNGNHIILNGAVTNGNGTFRISQDGHMTASGGNIAGWKIGNSAIQKDVKGNSTVSGYAYYRAFMQNPLLEYDDGQTVEKTNRRVFGLYGYDAEPSVATTTTPLFYVNTTGKLYAKNAEITGNITANTGKIGNWKISNGALRTENDKFAITLKCPTTYGPSGTPTNDCFVIHDIDSGSYPLVITSDGSIRARKGEIGGWAINSNYLSADQDEYAFVISGPKSKGNSDKYWIRATENGAVKFSVSKTGLLHATGATITGNSIITGNSVIRGDCIIQGYLSGNTICAQTIENDFTGITTFSASITLQDLQEYGAGYRIAVKNTTFLEGAHNETYIDILHNPAGGRVEVNATLYTPTGTVETSDLNLKNTISSISPSYSNLFNSLRPVTFKFNDGTSDRLHIGFIAQEVDEAISAAGLTRQDFAGLCIRDEGTENEKWGLRYGEFVALNTFEIQKLKARITALEEKLNN